MTTTHQEDTMTTIEGPDQIHYFAVLQATYRLALEINTGLKFRQSTLAALQHAGYTTKKTKKGALKDMVAYLQAEYDYTPSDSIAWALTK